MRSFVFYLSLFTLLMACSGNSTQQEASVATVAISGGDDMKYNINEIKVKAGQKVKLTLTHSGKMPKEAMGHNFVILKQGVDMAEFANKAVMAKDNDYIPEGDQIIAHTKMLGGGESDTIEFDAPAKGTYDFLCTFPGHWALMKGKFIVE